MKTARVVTIGLMLSWVVFQYIYIPFSIYFLNNSHLYAFSAALGAGVDLFHSLTVSTLLLSLFMLSLSIGLFISVFIYSPIEEVFLTGIKKFHLEKDIENSNLK